MTEAEAHYPCHWAEVEPGVWRFWNEPVDGIGSSGYLIRTPNGNLAFEGCAVYSRAALDAIAGLGGVQVLAASHPHSYGAIWQIQDSFDPELALHRSDLEWSGALCVSWPFDETLEPLPSLTLHLTAGRFAGDAVLHDAARKILLCRDCLKFELIPPIPGAPPRFRPTGIRTRHPADA